MTGTDTRVLRFTIAGTAEQVDFDTLRTLVAGYTGRDEAAVRHHIDELAAIGVAPPPEVPMFYPVEPGSVTSDEVTEVHGRETSGEVEPVLLRRKGRWYLGIGSDHTDRKLETVDIGDSKRACPKPIGSQIAEITSWDEFDWDACHARSWVDGRLYQDGSLAGLRTPQNLLGILGEREGDDGADLLCFAGTLPLLDGTFVYGTRWDLELTLPDGTVLTHSYTSDPEGR
ncbi:DUF2848 family protein [Gordonia sp. 'Campus']|uniref:DUF2848 family protein n=1 Tax=Gordonia sp. 'Campus' TaxID=2915824 RepID=UPI001EE3EFE8|nr:DUF2848 family protein [Gordonia sp. 'Campus']